MTARLAPQPARRAPVRVVAGSRRPRPRIGGWVVYTVIVALAFFGLIYSQTSLDSSAFELKELEAQIAVEEAHYQDLRLLVARLQSPARIAPAAADLGMVLPHSMQTVTAPGVVVDASDQVVFPVLTASP